jgi:putative transcriptional regulator
MKGETVSKLGDELIEGMREAVAHAKGAATGAREIKVELPDVRAIREQLHMSQSEFSESYRIPLATLQGWEQGRRAPDATASAYLNVIARLPREAKAAMRL